MAEHIRDNYQSLIFIPAGDGNFKSALNYATDDELTKARDYLTEHTFANKSRLAAVNKEIKRRTKLK
jgi:hypothetical protein